jgi:hypothetical protein
VHARPLDVLQKAGDQHPRSVADGIDIDLDALEIAIDPHGPIRVDHCRRRELPFEVIGGVAEVDRQPTDHERGTDDDRVPDPLGERQRLLDAVGHTALGLRDPETVEQRGEADALLGLVDSLEVAAEQRHAARCQWRGEVEGGLAAVRHHRGEQARARWRLGIDHAAHALRVERLEVQPR